MFQKEEDRRTITMYFLKLQKVSLAMFETYFKVNTNIEVGEKGRGGGGKRGYE